MARIIGNTVLAVLDAGINSFMMSCHSPGENLSIAPVSFITPCSGCSLQPGPKCKFTACILFSSNNTALQNCSAYFASTLVYGWENCMSIIKFRISSGSFFKGGGNTSVTPWREEANLICGVLVSPCLPCGKVNTPCQSLIPVMCLSLTQPRLSTSLPVSSLEVINISVATSEFTERVRTSNCAGAPRIFP